MPKTKARKATTSFDTKTSIDTKETAEVYDLIIQTLTNKYKDADKNVLYYELDDTITDVLTVADDIEIIALAEYAFDKEGEEDIDLYVETLLSNPEFYIDDVDLMVETLPSPMDLAFSYAYSLLFSTIKYRVIKNINPKYLESGKIDTKSRNEIVS